MPEAGVDGETLGVAGGAPGGLLSVVFPTHNERPNLEVLIPQALEVLADETVEIIVVDDASTDGSVEWLQALAAEDARIRPVFGDSLNGIGDALRRGYDAAQGDLIISLDADLSFETRILGQLVAALRGGLHLVVGSRYESKGSYEAPNATIARKRFVSGMANRILRFFVPVGVTDFSVNCRGIRRELWQRIELRERTNIWLIEMIVAAGIADAPMGSITAKFSDRRFGASKLRLGREIFKTGYRVLFMITRYRASRFG